MIYQSSSRYFFILEGWKKGEEKRDKRDKRKNNKKKERGNIPDKKIFLLQKLQKYLSAFSTAFTSRSTQALISARSSTSTGECI